MLELIQMNDIVTAFNEYFEVVDADTPERLQDVFRLRYQVLCIEQRLPGFEASRYPDGCECDSYDAHSSHMLLRHRPSGDFVGTARLILPDPLTPEKPFPIEQHAQLDPFFNINRLPRQHAAEVSRLLVVRRFRRRKGDSGGPENEIVVEDRAIEKPRRFPHPVLALAVGLIRMSAAHHITHWLSIMDPALNRLLTLYGLQHDPVGPLIEHHGQRRPYHVDLSAMLNRMHESHPLIWELVTDFGRSLPAPPGSAPVPISTVLADIEK
ncbi:PEP-CTERM/exosortase system-associated acyltransferase [Nitrosospira multiformis]|nr:PEP-CTERM/exosortase system-associated acyltransferase [Nitrosospira multiformis]